MMDVLWLPALVLLVGGFTIGLLVGDFLGYGRGHYAGQRVLRREIRGDE